MKNFNSIILIVFCIFTLFSSFGDSILAQPAIPSLSKTSSIILNSQPEVYVKNIVLDSKTYKAGDTVKGSFTLLNNKGQPVSDVYYKISLAGDYQKNNLAKTFYDSVKNGPLSLASRESKKIDFTYVLPKAVAGDNLGIQVSALLGSGMPMGWGDFMIKVEGEMSLLKVSKTFISINNNKFDFQTGVDVSQIDEAFLEVSLANPTKNNIEIIPKIKIYNNITPAISSELNLNTINIPANSSSSIKYELPKFENKAGVYVGNLSFFDANGNKRALDLQFNYSIPEINNFINTDASQSGISTGKVYTTRDYIFFAALILLGLGLIGFIVFLVIKFKKKIPFSLFIISISMLFWIPSAHAFSGGDGSVANPYKISTCVELQAVKDNMASNFILINNINCSDTVNWNSGVGFIPIGDSAGVFSGNLDGKGFTISDLYIKRTSKRSALFGATSGNISNINLIGVNVTGVDSVGSLVGYQTGGTIFNCHSTSTVISSGNYVGGLAGASNGIISSSSSMGNVSGVDQVGGLVGYQLASGRVLSSYSNANVTGNSLVGGLIGNKLGFIDQLSYSTAIYALTINIAGTSLGTVTGAKAGIYNPGAVVNFIATPSAGAAFAGWSGACTGTGACSITMNSAKSLTATFNYILTINIVGNGSGTVTGAGIYNPGAVVITVPTPGADSTFAGWSGACTGTGACSITMNSAKSLTATFLPITDPYKISTCVELQAVNNALSSNFILINDIDCSDTKNWNGGAGFIPIQDFYGNLNGNDFKIYDLTINNPGLGYVGLFSRSHGTISNISLINLSIKAGGYTGGLVGWDFGTINNSYSTGNVSGADYTGGLVGRSFGMSINNSHSTANVSGTFYVGGLVGESLNLIINNSYSTGNVLGTYYVGGLVGYQPRATINTSYSTANVSGTRFLGGLVGAQSGEDSIINNSYSTGNVSGVDYIGGFSGFPGSLAVINNSYSTGNVSGTAYVGGFFGHTIVWRRTGIYWDVNTSRIGVSGDDQNGAIGKTTEEMKTASTFSGWDFKNIWGLTTGFNNGYPCLRWQTDCVSAPENVIVSTPSCSGSTIRLSWPIVSSAAQYKIYKDNTFLATTTATSSDISNVSTSTVLSVSVISATGVESATSTGVSLPAGIKPTNLQISGFLADKNGNNLGTTNINMTPNQEFYLKGNATAENGLSQYLKMNYFSNITGVDPWILSTSTIFTTPNSSSSSTAIRGGQFSIGPFYASSTYPAISYYVSAYPSCVVDYATDKIYMNEPADLITYTIPPSASCGSANGNPDGVIVTTVPQGAAACSDGASQSNLRGSGSVIDPWKWDCVSVDSTDSCSATKTELKLDSKLNCSLSTSDTNQVNSTAVLTASTNPTCPQCTKKWTLIDSSNPAPGNLIPVSDKTNYTLKNIFTTVGLKTITAQVFSEDGSSYGNTCTTTTNIIQGESITKEI